MKKFLKIVSAGLLASLALTFSGCKVDEAYTLENLKDIDLKVALFQNGIQFRVADSTDVFRVDSLMKSTGLDTTGFIKQNEDGSYYISYSDKIDLGKDLSDLDLGNSIAFDALDVSQPISYGVNLDLPDGFDASVLIGLGEQEYTVPLISYDIDESVELAFIDGNDIPEMLVGLGEIVLDEVYAEIGVVFDNLPGTNETTYAIDATATLPSFFVPNTIELKGNVAKGETFSRKIKIEKFDLSSADIVKMREDGSKLSEEASIKGSASASNVTVQLADIDNLGVVGTASVKIGDANGTFNIKSFQAKIDYTMDETFRSPFFALPEAFEDATLDLPNAMVDLTVRTNMALPVGGSADLSATGAAQPIATLNFEVPMSLDPTQYEERTTHNEVSLNALLEEVTDSIDFAAHLATDKTKYCYIEPAAEYGLEFGFDLSLPLAFGAGTLVNYADTIALGSDTGKQIGSILRGSSIGFRANVENTIPLSADITIGFLSHNEETGEYTDIPLKKPITVKLPAPGEPGLIEIVIGADKDNEALETLTDMKLSIKVHANGQALKGEDYIVLSDIYLMLPQGVTFDGNILKDQNQDNQ